MYLDATATESSGRLYAKWRAYWGFRCIFLLYITSPVILVGLRVILIDWESFWLYALLKEVAMFTIFLSIVCVFHPSYGKMTVFELTEETEEEAEIL